MNATGWGSDGRGGRVLPLGLPRLKPRLGWSVAKATILDVSLLKE